VRVYRPEFRAPLRAPLIAAIGTKPPQSGEWRQYARSIDTTGGGFDTGSGGSVTFRVRTVGSEREVECYIAWGGAGLSAGTGALVIPISELDTLKLVGSQMKDVGGSLDVIFLVSARDGASPIAGFVMNGNAEDAATSVMVPAQTALVAALGAPTSGRTWALKFSVPVRAVE